MAIGATLASVFALIPDEPAPSGPQTIDVIRVSEGRTGQLRRFFERTR